MRKGKTKRKDYPPIPDYQRLGVEEDAVVYIENEDGTVTVINGGVLQLIDGDYLYEYDPVKGTFIFKDVLQVWF